MAPPPSSLAVDLPLYVLLTSAFTLPLVTSLASPSGSSRTQWRALLDLATKSVTLAFGSVGVIVLGAGALVVGEKLYHRFSTSRSDRGDRPQS
ncbi:uncharacterized protein JCM15063_003902 [Sporobolomyces koalae]|uniref:uncharacterized protein n=1 Tax=Sporobolomyces koalae TaxID=500713 RepID=UPI00316EBA10